MQVYSRFWFRGAYARPCCAYSSGCAERRTTCVTQSRHGLTTPRCSITSPWVEIAVTDDNPRKVFAVLIWDERQLLLDRSEHNVDAAPHQPYPQSVFEQAAHLYGAAITTRTTEELLRDDVPSDLGVLFRQSPQSTLLPFTDNARAEMQRIANESVAKHVSIVESLATICSSGSNGLYKFLKISEVPMSK